MLGYIQIRIGGVDAADFLQRSNLYNLKSVSKSEFKMDIQHLISNAIGLRSTDFYQTVVVE